MTIAKLNKISIVSVRKDKDVVLAKIQHLGFVHLRSINRTKAPIIGAVPSNEIDKLKAAIRYLADTPIKGKLKTQVPTMEINDLIDKILMNQKETSEKIDRRDFLIERITDLSIWGNFQLPHDEEINHHKLWFYKIKLKDFAAIQKDVVLHEIHRDNQFHYIVIIDPKEPDPTVMPVSRIHTGAISLQTLKDELIAVNERLDDLYEQRVHHTRFIFILKQQLARFFDKSSLQQAASMTSDEEHYFILQGWVPANKLPELYEFCQQNNVSLIVEEAEEHDVPPTMLETYQWSAAGSELVKFYQMPGYRTLDPSLLVFVSFTIFFAMILADAGYALVIALITLFYWPKLSKMNAGVWIKPLLFSICIASFIYGVMIGSYFGAEPSPGTLLAELHILNIHDFKTMMAVVLVIGCIHVIAANVMRAWFATQTHTKIHSLSYGALIVGVMLAIFGYQYKLTLLFNSSLGIISLSILIMMISASDLPVTNFKSFIKRLLYSLTELMHLSTLFGDVLSYLRLFALGLAGASLAITFNQIARQIAEASPHGFGWIMAILVLILGQSLNFIICLMSAVIHGLRLNYIEFFKWSVKEEGYQYDPLKKMEVDHE